MNLFTKKNNKALFSVDVKDYTPWNNGQKLIIECTV